MIEFDSLGHINIVVGDTKEAIEFYQTIFGAIPHQSFPNFKNIGFAKSAGFLDNPEEVNVTITFLEIPGASVFLELMEYHAPKDNSQIEYKKTNQLGGPRHIALRVKNIDEAFAYLKKQDGILMINTSDEYKPFRIDNIQPHEFYFFDKSKEASADEKQKVCDIVSQIRYFYFLDKYGIQWELEQGHSDIGN